MNRLKSEIDGLLENILSDYEKGRDIDNINTFDHPQKEIVIEIVKSSEISSFPVISKTRHTASTR